MYSCSALRSATHLRWRHHVAWDAQQQQAPPRSCGGTAAAWCHTLSVSTSAMYCRVLTHYVCGPLRNGMSHQC
ncbi:MAG: hypothetical protein GY782_06490 [Gammaproteobacteria bacterium]|nr:hypothetical protein [Gammaproteobacteria bacterium]